MVRETMGGLGGGGQHPIVVLATRPVTPLALSLLDDSDSCLDMPNDLDTRESKPTLYFGYGSNVWIDQMNRRCPENKYIGTAVLHDW